MSFIQEGDIPCQMQGAIIAESVLNKKPNSFDICVKVATEDGAQSDYYRMNISGDFSRMKNKGHLTNTEVTIEKLRELGFQGPDFSGWPDKTPQVDWNSVAAALAALVGPTIAHCERNQAGYINVKWLGGGGNTPVAVNPATLMQMSSQMQGGQQQQQQMQQGIQQQPAQNGGFQNVQQPQPGGFGNMQQQPAQNGGFIN